MELKWYNPKHWGKIKKDKKQEKENADLLINWYKNGCPSPPPHIVKQNTIHKYRVQHNCSTLVETGTFMGDMVYAMKDYFSTIYSIELSADFVQRARKRFSDYPHISILEGDSASILKEVIKKINNTTLFWLDGHYSGHDTARGNKQTPVEEELIILSGLIKNSAFAHVIIIDDARLFVGKDDYPTLDYLFSVVQNLFPAYNYKVENDSIILTVN